MKKLTVDESAGVKKPNEILWGLITLLVLAVFLFAGSIVFYYGIGGH